MAKFGDAQLDRAGARLISRVEQKEFHDSPQNREKGRALFCTLMTRPAWSCSLRSHVEHKISKITGYENIDKILRHTAKEKRADYLAFERNIIVEQKEFHDSPQNREKGRALEELLGKLAAKNKFAGVNWPATSRDEEKQVSILAARFNDKIKDYIHTSDKQIRSTKRILNLPSAIGVLLLIFDEVAGIFPPVIRQRVERTFAAKIDDSPIYADVEIVIFVCRLKNIQVSGNRTVMGRIIRRNDKVELVKYSYDLLEVLNRGERTASFVSPVFQIDTDAGTFFGT